GVAELAFDEGRHDAPGPAHRAGELRERELAAGEVRAERALAGGAVAVAALRTLPVPQRLAGLGVARLRERRAITKRQMGERQHEERDDESVHGASLTRRSCSAHVVAPQVYTS